MDNNKLEWAYAHYEFMIDEIVMVVCKNCAHDITERLLEVKKLTIQIQILIVVIFSYSIGIKTCVD